MTEDQKKALRALGYVPIGEDVGLWSRAVRHVRNDIAELEARGADLTQLRLPSGASWFELLAEMEQKLASALRGRAERLAAERAERLGQACGNV
jgi:hypothetical protein